MGSNSEKLKFLEHIIAEKKLLRSCNNSFLGRQWNRFLEEFNYKNEFLNKHSTIMFKKTKEQSYYINKNKWKIHRTIKKADITKPVKGKTYYFEKNIFEFDNIIDEFKYLRADTRKTVFLWYEKRIPEILKELGLKCKKSPIYLYAMNKKRPQKAYAWEITDGLDNFKSLPITMFSTKGYLKMDCETLPKLNHAAKKFGLSPLHLNIVNDYITKDGIKHTGSYDCNNDEITITGNSLAILAHEGWHRLCKKGMVSTKEYLAVVNAGKSLALHNKDINDEILQKDSKGNYIYPKGPERNNEYAALFVETYYENNKLARKHLTGAKIKITEKILGYIKDVSDIIKSRCGDSSARARLFLRRIERGIYEQEKTKIKKFSKQNPYSSLALDKINQY